MRNKTDEESWIDEAIQKLIDLGYQSDERFAELIVRKGLESKSWGRARIEAEMFRKGVPSDVAKEAMVVLQDDDPATRADEALGKKFRLKNLVEQKDRARATRYLASRGFDFQSISAAISRHNDHCSIS
jgi:regulatory protein